MTELRLFFVQRLSALLLAALGLLHLGVVVFALRRGVSAAAILERTGSSPLWPVFYGVFAVVAATHVALGLRTLVNETFGRRSDLFYLALWAGLMALGLRVVARIA